MDDVGVQLAFELFVRVEHTAAVELVLQVAEDLLGRRVVQAVALAAHGPADAGAFELVPPPLVLVLPSHISRTIGSTSGLDTCAGRDRWW